MATLSGKGGFEKSSLGRELGNSRNILLACPYATRDWHMTSWEMEYVPVCYQTRHWTTCMFVPETVFSLFSLLFSAFIYGICENLSSFEIKDTQTWISKQIFTKQYHSFFFTHGKHQNLAKCLTGSREALPFSSGVGVAAVWRGGTRAESLLLLTNRGVSEWTWRQVYNPSVERFYMGSHCHHVSFSLSSWSFIK